MKVYLVSPANPFIFPSSDPYAKINFNYITQQSNLLTELNDSKQPIIVFTTGYKCSYVPFSVQDFSNLTADSFDNFHWLKFLQTN